ncbi:BMP family ABC transporter substrate-binding protein [Glycomyces sp. TRM65418]|uniref:BMP family lipoprotein n=1 Tax=Glycomyces sp. TRM65418 TaxID=2867006 RepID=UPI001CE59720|nr:BMP family ABC transporter substrate-binding protein [Glycomyces sp. TRM65418]MCC3763598.1 BMP family ABC transporter substrate-binding protein [Glycomyces sp. TRM65418]QZD57580.1 BMP family ABC transporter substrate-binding protein [Glycomyces sp. TRM65418]
MAVKPYKLALVGLSAVGLAAVAACGEAPSDSGDDNADASFLACMVTDSGGVDDKSFNESSWNGMLAAEEENDDIKVDFKESSSETDYDPNLQSSVDDGCNFIVGVGGLMTENVNAIATANPDVSFATVDGFSEVENVYSIQFDTAQSAFLAGYVAAAQTQTGTVATWGGLQIPPVTIFMDGFARGIAKHNEDKGTDVQLLGWDVEAQEGTFINGFESATDGKSQSDTFIEQGADIIFPVAGPAGIGALTAAAEDDAVTAIWVDTDGYESTDYGSEIITSAEKGLANAVKDSVLAAYDAAQGGDAVTGSYIGTLENGGVSLAPFHDFEDDVSDETKAEIDALTQQIIDGTLVVESPASPTAG